MLLKVSSHAIVQRCDSCGAERQLPYTSLQAGIALGDLPVAGDPNMMALSACPDCGAKEFFNRVAATDPGETSDTADHRRGVNALHAALVAAGRAAPGLQDGFANESIDTDKADIPWSFSGAPPALSGWRDPNRIAVTEGAASPKGGE